MKKFKTILSVSIAALSLASCMSGFAAATPATPATPANSANQGNIYGWTNHVAQNGGNLFWNLPRWGLHGAFEQNHRTHTVVAKTGNTGWEYDWQPAGRDSSKILTGGHGRRIGSDIK